MSLNVRPADLSRYRPLISTIINTLANESVRRSRAMATYCSLLLVGPEVLEASTSGSPGATTRTTTSPGNRRRIWEQELTLHLLMPAPVTSKMMRWAYHELYFNSNRLGGGGRAIYVSEQAADGSFGPGSPGCPELSTRGRRTCLNSS